MEGEILQGAVRAGLAPNGAALRLEVASRTDRGVHARANLLALSSPLPGPVLLRALNGIGPDLWFTGAARVPEGFRVRSARSRTYRYYEPRAGARLARWREAAACFRGSVDVREFSRGLPAEPPTHRVITSVTVAADGPWLRVTVRAPAFVWGMVRKIVAALRGYDAGTISAEALRAAVRGEGRLALPLAEPERLVLWSVDHGRRFPYRAVRGSRRQARALAEARTQAAARAWVLARLDPWPGRGEPSPRR